MLQHRYQCHVQVGAKTLMRDHATQPVAGHAAAAFRRALLIIDNSITVLAVLQKHFQLEGGTAFGPGTAFFASWLYKLFQPQPVG
ncbi:hypothetical protein D3C72_2322930 [compost metagenome]